MHNREKANDYSNNSQTNKRRHAALTTLKVSTHSNPNKEAGALAGYIREEGKAEIQTIGAGALNQAIKAIAITRGFVASGGIDLICIPAFCDVEIDGGKGQR